MKKNQLLFFIVLFILSFSIQSCNQKLGDATTSSTDLVGVGKSEMNKYKYETVPGDPMGVKIYTMQNGMKVYMSVNKDEPRIQTNIAVRAGSKHDPPDATGLAHYLEHMLFKGNSQIASLDWESEKVLLQKISDLYEKRRNTVNENARKAIYTEIDSLSGIAAKYVAANEYDKLIGSLGAKGTNAYTWIEQTVYVNDIPSNEVDKWMKLESERFKELALRLFHTELEAVYEEFNIGQDSDFRKVMAAKLKGLFPKHPYGQWSTIGTGPHLKNPSHEKIHDYFNKYYVPNNMAVVVSGDFEPDEMAATAEKYFGAYERQAVPKFTFDDQPEITAPIHNDVYGQQSESVDISWRAGGIHSGDQIKLMMLEGILANGQAGLIDININQKQKLLSGNAYHYGFEDYSVFSVSGEPRDGQTMKEVAKILMEEVEKVKKGEFDDYLMDAVIKDYKLSEIQANESNRARAGAMTNAFIKGLKWGTYVDRWEAMEALTKEDVMAFAKEVLSNSNYVETFKHSGEDKDKYKVEKPSITPVELNRANESEFATAFQKEESPRLSPAFINYSNEIKKDKLSNGIDLNYIKNKSNELFTMHYIVEMGSDSDKILPLAVNYLKYLGTEKYSAEELQKEFFKLGLRFDVFSGSDRVYVTLQGLEESFEQGVELFEHVLANVTPNEEALKNTISGIITERENSKKDKRTILRSGIVNYVRYGADNPFTDKLSRNELELLPADKLISTIKRLCEFEHNILYYGRQDIASVKSVLDKHHNVIPDLKPVKEPKKYAELDTEKKVYFVDFPMVQAEIMMISKGTEKFNKDEYIMSELYNTYFGFGLSSIVFQEIRESKALAYSAYSFNASPRKKENAHLLQAYVGTQVDKLPEAVPAMLEIINNMPVSESQIETARESIMKKIESERITKMSMYWNQLANQRRDIDYDVRKDVYNKMKTVTVDELVNFQKENIKGRDFSICVLGSKESVDMDFLKTLGDVEELTLEQVFGY